MVGRCSAAEPGPSSPAPWPVSVLLTVEWEFLCLDPTPHNGRWGVAGVEYTSAQAKKETGKGELAATPNPSRDARRLRWGAQPARGQSSAYPSLEGTQEGLVVTGALVAMGTGCFYSAAAVGLMNISQSATPPRV